MNNVTIDGVTAEVMRELRNDFTFFTAMSMFKTMAMMSGDPKKFIKEMVWKWREAQINALSTAAVEMEKRMREDKDLTNMLGVNLDKVNKTQREILVMAVRTFCESIETLLITSMDVGGEQLEEGEEQQFQG